MAPRNPAWAWLRRLDHPVWCRQLRPPVPSEAVAHAPVDDPAVDRLVLPAVADPPELDGEDAGAVRVVHLRPRPEPGGVVEVLSAGADHERGDALLRRPAVRVHPLEALVVVVVAGQHHVGAVGKT